MVKNINSSQFQIKTTALPDTARQPRAKQLDQNFGFTPAKPRLNPAQAAAAPSGHDPALSPVQQTLYRQVFRIF